MYVVMLEFDTLKDAQEVNLDELTNLCNGDNDEPVHQTLAGAMGTKMWFESVTNHSGKYEVYKLEKVS